VTPFFLGLAFRIKTFMISSRFKCVLCCISVFG
jgi:hypothetical protein